MSTYSTLIAWKVAVIVVEILVSCEWIRRASLMINSTSCPGGLTVVDVIACLRSVNTASATERWVHPVSPAARSCITAAQSFVMMRCTWIQPRWRGWVIHLLVHLRRVLRAVFVAVTDDFFRLIVEPRVLLSAWIIKAIRPKENLILGFIVLSSIWTSTGLSITSTSHHHGGLARGDARTELLASIILSVLRVNLVIAIA